MKVLFSETIARLASMMRTPLMFGNAGRQWTDYDFLTSRTLQGVMRRVVKAIPGQASGLLEALAGCSARCVFERIVIDTGIDDLPWHTSNPELHLTIPDAVLEEISWVEHISMPYHEYIYT